LLLPDITLEKEKEEREKGGKKASGKRKKER